MDTTPLRDLVEDRLNQQWDQWALAHPHLAQVIDRTRLAQITANQLTRDPAFVQAMHDADLDASRLAAAAQLIGQAERTLRQFLPI